MNKCDIKLDLNCFDLACMCTFKFNLSRHIAETTTSGSPDDLANQLLNQTLNQDMSTLNASQLEQLVNGVENMLSGPNISLELGHKVLSLIDRLLGSSTNAMASSSNRLIKAVDMLGLKLFIQDKKESMSVGSLALMVTKIDGTNFMGASFSVTDPVSLQVKLFTFHFGVFKLLHTIVYIHFIHTRSLSALVPFSFLSLLPQGNLTCVFWDFEKNYGSGGWNNTGCAVLNTSTENETVCSCNHLTSFAVLMDLSRDVITDPVQATILTFITYIGCGISAIFLAVTLLSYLAFEKIRRDIPSKLLINLCFALLLLNMVFLLDSWLALYADAVGLCISTAFFLHYFLLASFTWMGLEALHLYLAIVKVFNNFMSQYILKFALAGWGVPLLVVIIVIAVDKNNYGLITYAKYTDGTTDDFCWLKNNTAFYVAVVAYFCVIFVFNMVMFVVVMVQLRRIKRQNPHNNQYRSGLQDLRSIAGLTILLGLTWGFAFFAWGVVSLAFMYLFTIFNSLQGFFIFVFHCAVKETVRRQWRTYLCCGKYRLAENSDWSRTATQNTTKKTSLVTANSGSRTQTASRSSSLSTNSIPQSNSQFLS
uniref:Adhesion G protein-coupled receptor G2a n=1 Tax=Pygocentrus nattereri TaxID=42514 RepID=A0AAR2KN49_PYGNA